MLHTSLTLSNTNKHLKMYICLQVHYSVLSHLLTVYVLLICVIRGRLKKCNHEGNDTQNEIIRNENLICNAYANDINDAFLSITVEIK